ncbi:MAG: M23 family metallopeptidase [Alicyclobacillaceae bacterium]|nr:M23 family metallopeptidase [Alicyclobacillaceae bacterium]
MVLEHVVRKFDESLHRGQPPHAGLDIAMPMDTPVQSCVGGVVECVGPERGLSEAVWIREPDGFRILFANLDRAAVHRGDRVRAGDVIGLSGQDEGAPGEVPHLHLGVFDADGHAVDPDRYFSAWNWLHTTSNRLKNSEEAFLTDTTERVVTTVAHDLFAGLGEWALHMVAPVSFVVFALSMLGVIAGVVRMRRWAFYSGLVATIGYREGWS